MIRFSDILGQKEAVGHLQNALRDGHVSHAYIISGEEGTGKTELALAFANALMCTDRKEENGLLEACGQCRSCIQAGTFNQPDIIIVNSDSFPVEPKKNTIGVKLIRAMISDVSIKPYESDHKIYIVPDAHKLTVQAQNALLKTLEEPPEYAVIILLCEGTTAFLPTVLSRCVTLRLHSVDIKTLSEYLVKKGCTEQEAALYAGISHGNPGKAVYIAGSSGYREFVRQTVEFLEKLAALDSYTILQFAESLTGSIAESPEEDDKDENSKTGGKKEDYGSHINGGQGSILSSPPLKADTFMDLAGTFYRDIMYYKSTDDAENLIYVSEVQYIINTAGKISYDRLERISAAMSAAEVRRAAGGKDSQVFELMFLSFREALRMR